MRWPWSRKRHCDPRAASAARAVRYEATQLEAVQARQAKVDRVTDRLAELRQRDLFAEAVEAALARRRQ